MFGPDATCRNGVLLVNLPYAGVQHPSLALGLLHARLAEAGIPVRSYYANLDFAGAYADKVGGLRKLIDYFAHFQETPYLVAAVNGGGIAVQFVLRNATGCPKGILSNHAVSRRAGNAARY